MWAVMLWLDRLSANGPASGDAEVDTYVRLHVEDSVMVTYSIVPGERRLIVIDSVLDAHRD